MHLLSAMLTTLKSSLYSNMDEHEALVQATCAVLLELRKKNGLSQYDLAKLSGLARSYIGDVERGARSLSIMNVAYLAEHLGVSASSLLKRAERKMEEFTFVRLESPESKTQEQYQVEARIKTLTKELTSAQTKVKVLTKSLARAKAKAQVLAKEHAKALAKATLKANAEARKRAHRSW